MRDVFEQILGWGVIAGIVLAVLLGRKRGQDNRAAAIAAAHASGFAEGGAAAAEAHANQTVQVAVDASRRGSAAEYHEAAAADAAWHRVLRGGSAAGSLDNPRGHYDPATHYDYHDLGGESDDYDHDDSRPRRVPVGRDRSGSVPSRYGDSRADLLRVRPSETERG